MVQHQLLLQVSHERNEEKDRPHGLGACGRDLQDLDAEPVLWTGRPAGEIPLLYWSIRPDYSIKRNTGICPGRSEEVTAR